MVDLWPHSQPHLREGNLLLKISHYTNCATGRSHASTVALTQEEIETLITNPDPQTPSHHQVDPRIFKAYLMGESILTYLPGHMQSRHFWILPMYLPRDWFLPSELVVPLVHAQYPQDYCIWKRRLDANTRSTDYLVDHLRDPLPTVSVQKKRIGYIKTSTIKLTALIYGGNPLLT
jgi:hypothetical protein